MLEKNMIQISAVNNERKNTAIHKIDIIKLICLCGIIVRVKNVVWVIKTAHKVLTKKVPEDSLSSVLVRACPRPT